MLTELGKELRMLRLSNNEILKDMANKLGITSAYLSAIENGKREPTKKFMDTLFAVYNFDAEQHEKLMDAYYKTKNSISIDITRQSQDHKNLGLVFARKFDGLTDEQIQNIIKILNKENH